MALDVGMAPRSGHDSLLTLQLTDVPYETIIEIIFTCVVLISCHPRTPTRGELHASVLLPFSPTT